MFEIRIDVRNQNREFQIRIYVLNQDGCSIGTLNFTSKSEKDILALEHRSKNYKV